MAKYLFSFLLLLLFTTTTATSTSNVGILGPTPSTTSATTPAPTPTPTASNSTTATPTVSPCSSPTPTGSSIITTTPTFGPSLAPIPTITSTFSLPPTPPLPLTPQKEGLQFGVQEHFYNIIDAIIGAGDFKNWAYALTMADPATFPISATLFIPSDNSPPPNTTAAADPLIFPYHIVPQRLSFADLQQFKALSRLPTLLLDKSILITNNSASNYTLDGSHLTHPDIYTNAAIAVHGIDNLLDYSVYGAETSKNFSEPNMVAPPPTPASPPRNFVPTTADDEELSAVHHHHGESDAACLCTKVSEVWTVFLIFSVVLASKFQRMILVH